LSYVALSRVKHPMNLLLHDIILQRFLNINDSKWVKHCSILYSWMESRSTILNPLPLLTWIGSKQKSISSLVCTRTRFLFGDLTIEVRFCFYLLFLHQSRPTHLVHQSNQMATVDSELLQYLDMVMKTFDQM